MKIDATRTPEQNAKLWPLLRDVAHQLQWPVNGIKTFLTEDDWKDIFTAALTKHHRITAGIDGGFVILGMRTHKMKANEMSDLIELIYAFGANHDVKWTEET